MDLTFFARTSWPSGEPFSSKMEYLTHYNTSCPGGVFSDLGDLLTDHDARNNQNGVSLPPYSDDADEPQSRIDLHGPPDSGNQSVGRPKKKITVEDLERCKGYTLKAAALELKAGESTLKRRIKDLTCCKTWTEFKQSPSVSQHAHGIERMQGKDKVVVILVSYGGIERPFDLTDIEEQTRFEELQKLIEQSFHLQSGTYEIKWIVGDKVLTISCNNNVKACFRLASELQCNNISLTVTIA